MLAFPMSMTKKIQKRSLYKPLLDTFDINPIIDLFRSLGTDVVCCYDKEYGYIFPYCGECEYDAIMVDEPITTNTIITVFRSPLIDTFLSSITLIIGSLKVRYDDSFAVCTSNMNGVLPFSKIRTISLVDESNKLNLVDILNIIETFVNNTDIKDMVSCEALNDQFFADQFGYIMDSVEEIPNMYDVLIENVVSQLEEADISIEE
ncbi:MAG TPA: hypothetical protein P5513_06295 [Candidatus Diapherotrites archaeon]|jgi:hypothetical protein|nr:hypothetical protein [Candidatus Diapherotrites archaeon]